jgi:hypothetical protein
MLIPLLIGIFALSNYMGKSTFKVSNSHENIVLAYGCTKKWHAKTIKMLSLVICIGFGVIGCWWFFAIGLVKQILSYLFYEQLKTVVEKIIEKRPDLKVKEEEKLDSKLKFKFVKKA